MYKALVTRIRTRELPGSDNIVIGQVGNYQVLVSKETEDGQLGIFFEAGGQLSQEFAERNDLIRRKDEQGNPAGGYFEENRKVRSLKMRGAVSEGFWCPINFVAYTGSAANLKEGDQFDELNGHPICNKYFTPQTLRSMRNRDQKKAIEIKMFHKHIDTEALKRGIGMIPEGALVTITEKMHGTSARYGHVLCVDPIVRSKFKAFFAKLFKQPTEIRMWKHMNGSRNVILKTPDNHAGFHGKEGFRFAATNGIALHKGEILYGELCGFTETGEPIMAPQNTEGLKNAPKRFKGRIVYDYGCQPEESRFDVYRITQVNEDGHAVDLSWAQVKARCRELGLNHVWEIDQFIYDGDPNRLSRHVESIVEGDKGEVRSTYGDHPMEGVVVRYESEHGTGWLKQKSFLFGVLEGYLKERDDYVDTEEAA